MGELLRAFTYPRNAFASSVTASAAKALEVIARVESGKLLPNPSDPGRIKDEPFNDMRLFLAIVGGSPDAPFVTQVGQRYRELTQLSPDGAWRWLLTRSMWLYSVPNGTNVHCNRVAKDIGVSFNFFDMITRLSVHLGALPYPRSILYFDELFSVLSDDANWMLSGEELFLEILSGRKSGYSVEPHEHASLLDDLESQHKVGRDYLNTLLKKGFGQTGLYTLVQSDAKIRGMILDPAAYQAPVLAQRLRFVLDHPRRFDH